MDVKAGLEVSKLYANSSFCLRTETGNGFDSGKGSVLMNVCRGCEKRELNSSFLLNLGSEDREFSLSPVNMIEFRVPVMSRAREKNAMCT